MKYRILVERKNDNYVASCSGIESLTAVGESFNQALENLQKNIYCYLRDPQAEMEIVMKTCNNALDEVKFKAIGTLK